MELNRIECRSKGGRLVRISEYCARRRRAAGTRRSLVDREDCSVRIRLADEYSRLVTELNHLLDSLRLPSPERNDGLWTTAETARTSSQKAWEALEGHIKDHRCIELQLARP